MPSLTDLKEELDDLNTMKSITSALTESSAGHLKKIRDNFQRNVKLYQEISDLYHLVRISYFKIPAQKNTPLPKVQLKTLSVAVTSNQRFYGNINSNIMRLFVEKTRTQNSDLMVVGQTGQSFMKISSFGRNYQSQLFQKDTPSVDECSQFVEKTINYDSILLYYPKFVSLVNQTVGISDITQAAAPEGGEKEEIKVLFEPDLPKILDFFNHQVRRLLFLRIMLETDLSLTAARLLAMSAAEERSGDLIKEKQSEIRKNTASFINAKLLETFSSLRLYEEE
ncbi:MAG: hypothetical protein UV73_C0013G0005 [Candidatus Gottesmanbacteria bacterium GW2011_GWA2_43_14]|uniref:ATP synthase gamma chain n=1 Tax=Candidatus Gottesmanbacteria bacterium GW2011_GWA2_43_14 TaxID=1618443 RepID=A0A0G1DDA2_9BACT|nr:MAG: hypothetical protein UV73_C0013G0005 [Candidatus Gottesmanbacteria bacterium GW2011_GWA2_43_14]